METRTVHDLVFTVTDLKQYAYCPRVVYYTYCLPLLRPTTYKMERGITAHEKAGRDERRRTLAAYGLEEGQRHFDVDLNSEVLGLRGRVDMVIEAGEGEERELIPVDYKHSRRQVGTHLKQQLTAYGIMLEETWGGQVRRGFVYSLVTRKVEEARLSEKRRAQVAKVVTAMREMVEKERMPGPARSRRPCVNCEFRRFCNDVL